MNIEEINNEVIDSINKNFYKKRNNDIVLKDNQIEVLLRYDIDINNIGSMSELIYIIEDVLEECDYPDDLDYVANELSEYNYYNNTNK